MPIIFDEISADVQAPPPAPAITQQPAPNGNPVDPQALARELARQAERAARLVAD
jgi:hypothetical protein